MINGLLKELIYLFNIYFSLKYYLREFKKINIIILKKLKKEDYIIFKVYYLIILLSILNKTLKLIIIK